MTRISAQDLPPQLTCLPNWLGWRAETRKGSSKSTKVPYNLQTACPGSSTRPADWLAFEEAARLLDESYDGLGFALTDGIVGADFDDCYNNSGSLKPWVDVWLNRYKGTYSEISPSGSGIKVWSYGRLPGPGKKVFVNDAGDICKESDPRRDGAVELYGTGRYFTVTGQALGPLTVVDCQQATTELYTFLCGGLPQELRIVSNGNAAHRTPSETVTEGNRHAFLLSTAARWRNDGMSAAAVLAGLRQVNRDNCTPPKLDYELRAMADWVATKPPKYRLVPQDIERSRLHSNAYVTPTPDGEGDSDSDTAVAPANINAQLFSLVDQIIASRDPSRCYDDELFELAAQAEGSAAIVARGRLKRAFGDDIVLKGIPGSWNDRFNEARNHLNRSYVRDPDSSDSAAQNDLPGLAQIVISDRQLRDIAKEAVAALHARNDPPALFVRTGELVHVIQDERERPSVAIVTESYLRGALTRSADFLKRDNHGELRNTFPPVPVVNDIAAFNPVLWPFPPLLSVAEIPTLRPDGTILSEPGYDPTSHVFYAPATTLKTLPFSESPTQAEALAARKLIDEAIGEFPYADAASRANTFGLLLTPVLRPAIRGCIPLAAVDAPQAGTGKSLLIDVLSIITTGRPSAMVPYPYKEEEMQKQILASLLAGRQIICFDNLAGELRSPALAMALTAKEYEARLLGFSRNVMVPNRSTWIVTGNNIRPAGDMPRRCYQIRLNAKSPKPYSGRKFMHPNLLQWVEENRSELLHALLVLARYWFASGCPAKVPDPIGSFEEWHQTIGSIVTLARVPGFLSNYADFIDQEDESPRQWEDFLAFLLKEYYRDADSSRFFTVADLMERIHTSTTSPLRDALPAEIADCLEKKANHRIVVGKMFSSRRERRFGSGEDQYWLEREDSDSAHKGAALWRIRRETASQPPQVGSA